MRQYTGSEVETIVKDEVTLSLEALIRVGARRMLQAALDFEVEAYVENLQDEKDERGHRQVVRNGSHKPRELITGVGHLEIRQPRVHDRREDKTFSSAILPRYMRRAPSIDALIPALYLKGVSTSSFPEALSAILGENAVGLSPANIVRLKQIWDEEYREWQHRDLSDKHYVYVWADGIYFQVRLEPDRPCVLVIIGATKDSRKELLAIEDRAARKQAVLGRCADGPEKKRVERSACPGHWRWRSGFLGSAGGSLPWDKPSALLGA